MPNTPALATLTAHIARELFACAAKAGNSEHKRAHFINLPAIVLAQARAIALGTYQPQALTVFAVTDPKLREIFAPTFPDRLQHFMRQPGHKWYCKLDIRAFFPSIDRAILRQLWDKALPKLPHDKATRQRLNQVVLAILAQNPIDPPPAFSGQWHLLKQVPPHKSLFHTAPGKGLPIGSLSSQFFANVYLHELDHFVKHTLKVRGYVRYVDDFVLLADSAQALMTQRKTRPGLARSPGRPADKACGNVG
jgi:RNA-directed DNA polymerase